MRRITFNPINKKSFHPMLLTISPNEDMNYVSSLDRLVKIAKSKDFIRFGQPGVVLANYQVVGAAV